MSDEQHSGRPVKRWLGIAAIVFAVVLVLAIGAFLYWALTPLGPSPEAVSALTGDAEVSVTQEKFGWAFTPNVGTPVAGLVFYPGGRVDPRSYAPLAHDLAERGVHTVITPMPLNLAVFAPNKAAEVIDAYPEIDVWAVGGHSLGGAMAAQFVSNDAEAADALLLLAAYPAGGVDLSGADLISLSMRGTLDGLVSEQEMEESLPSLPRNARYRRIEGGNHAGFGNYGEQPGDNAATISPSEQQQVVVDTFVPMLRRATLSPER